jgi:FkbM family methyltransferase
MQKQTMIPKTILQTSKDPYPEYVQEMWQEQIDESQNNKVFTVNAFFNDKEYKFNIHDPSLDICISSHILFSGCWEPHISKIILDAMKPDGIFVDIGANIGWHTKAIQEHGFNVISFEPEPVNWNLLQKNCTKEGSVLHNLGLGDITTSLRIERDPANYGNSFISENGKEQINVVRLDDIIDVQTAKKVNVVKMDVQGYEAKVIIGGQTFFNSLQPGTVLVIEINPIKLKKELVHIWKFISKCQSSYAICFWGNQGAQTILPVVEAINQCLSPSADVLTRFSIQEHLEFDMVVIV